MDHSATTVQGMTGSRGFGVLGAFAAMFMVGTGVTVSAELIAGDNTVYIKSDGKTEGSVPADRSRPGLADLPTQVLLGELPAALLGPRTPSSRALLIGIGSGVTLGALLEGGGPGRRLANVDVLELEPAYLDVLRRADAIFNSAAGCIVCVSAAEPGPWATCSMAPSCAGAAEACARSALHTFICSRNAARASALPSDIT